MLHETPVVFPGTNANLAGKLVRNTASFETRQIGVLVTGSWLTVKEQMPLLYARRLASLGYTAFIFDFSGFGQSQGEPRQAEIPARKIADICCASEFLATLGFVEPDKIGHVAICASAQYALRAIARGARISAFASVAGWYHDPVTIAPFYGGPKGVKRRMGFAEADVEDLLRSHPRSMAPAYDPGNERAGMHFELEYYASSARGAVPQWTNEMAPMSWAHWLTFDGVSAATSHAVPTLMVHGPDCALPDNAKRVYEKLAGPKRLDWLEGVQTDFYDQPEQVDQAVAAIDDWFRTHLAAGRTKAESRSESTSAAGE